MKLEDETVSIYDRIEVSTSNHDNSIDMKETETAEDVSQNKSDENITKIFKKLMKIKRVPRH